MATIKAYDMVNKEKDVTMINPVINVHNNNGKKYQVKGKSKKGNYIYTFVSEADAKKFIKDGTAKKGSGW